MTTQQLHWQDRDTAGHDILQLAYYAPPFISQLALKLLQAIRSPLIVPDLAAIVHDTERETWQRRYALRAIDKTSDDFFMPELAQFARDTITEYVESVLDYPPILSELGYDAMKDISQFVQKHPSNLSWFIDVLDDIELPYVLQDFLEGQIRVDDTSDYTQQLTIKLLQLYDEYPNSVYLWILADTYGKNELMTEWCDNHFELIRDLCIISYNNRAIPYLAQRWEKLKEALFAAGINTEPPPPKPREPITEPPADISNAPAHRFLEETYQAALTGDKKAYAILKYIAQSYSVVFVPFSAVALHYLGKLQDRYDVQPTLLWLVQYWADVPIITEAGDALIKKPSSVVWLVLINSFFINSRKRYDVPYMSWITYVTDILSADTQSHQRESYHPDIERRSWFLDLAQLPENEAQELIAKYSKY